MKRALTMLLAALLLVGCMAPALAEESTSPAPESRYDQFGPWGQWSAEQHTAAEQWSEADWEDYWVSYDNWLSRMYNQYWEDYEQWSEDYYGTDDETWEDYLIQSRIELGVPFPEGNNVSLNGTYLGAKALGDGGALVREGRVMVPFRGFFEAQGAAVRFADGVATATLKNGDTLRMTMGSTVLELVQGGRITELDMGAEPYTKDGLLYLPVRLAAEAMGLDVYWDDFYGMTHLTDWDALRRELDGQLATANTILAAALAAQDPDQTYATTERLSVTGTLYGEREHDTAQLSMDLTGLRRGGSMSADVTLRLDLGDMRDTIFSALPEELLTRLEDFSGGRYSVIADSAGGRLFYKGSNLSTLDETLPDNTWIVSSTALTGGELPQEGDTLGSLLVERAKIGFYYDVSPWDTVMEQAQPALLLFGDENFTSRTDGEKTTYTLKLDILKLAKRAQALGMLEDSSLSDLLDSAGTLPKLALGLTAQVSGGRLTAFDVEGSVKYKGACPVDVDFRFSGTPLSATGTLSFKGTYVGKLELAVGSTAVATDKTVPTAPPAGEPVWDWDVLMGFRAPSVPKEYGVENYLNDTLDAWYTGSASPAYLAATGISQQEVMEQSENDLANHAYYLSLLYCPDFISQSENDRLVECARALRGKLKYEVGKAVSVDGGYEVPVTVTTIALNGAMGDEPFATNDAALDKLEQVMPTLQYGQQVEITATVSNWYDGTVSMEKNTDLTDLFFVSIEDFYISE